MSVALSAKGASLLEDLPPELADAPEVQQVVDVLARELQRIEDAAAGIAADLFPATATDDYAALSMWESMLGLPVKLPGATTTQRQQLVLATIQQRGSASGLRWIDLISQALGTSGWVHQEGPGDYQVTITIPYSPGGLYGGQVVQLARRVTPAHLQVNSGFTGGFVIGVSNIGDVI